jgi:hypothetical protein
VIDNKCIHIPASFDFCTWYIWFWIFKKKFKL